MTYIPSTQTFDSIEAAKAIDKLVIVCLTMTIWSGQKTLQPGEMERVGGESLPTAIADLGAKKICNPAALAPFGKIRTRAYRLLRRYGVSFCKGAIAIPLDRSVEILDQIDLLIDEYNREKAQFIQDYDRNLEEWIQQNPGYESLIRSGALSKAEVQNKFFASISTMKVENLREKDCRASAQLACTLSAQLLDEVSADAEKYFKGICLKDEIPHKGVEVVRRLRDKMFNLGFLSGNLVPLVETIDSVLMKIQGTKALDGKLATEYKAVVGILANRNLLEDFVNGGNAQEPEVPAVSDQAAVSDLPVPIEESREVFWF